MSDAPFPTILRSVYPSFYHSHNVYNCDARCVLRHIELWVRSLERVVQTHVDGLRPWYDRIWLATYLPHEKEHINAKLTIMAFDVISEILYVNFADPVLWQNWVAFTWRTNGVRRRNSTPNRSCLNSQAVSITYNIRNFRAKCPY